MFYFTSSLLNESLQVKQFHGIIELHDHFPALPLAQAPTTTLQNQPAVPELNFCSSPATQAVRFAALLNIGDLQDHRLPYERLTTAKAHRG